MINTIRPADILEATCQCTTGNDYRTSCKHLSVLCFALLDYDQNKTYEVCTQRFQQRHHPTRESSHPVNLLDIYFTSLKHKKAEENKPKYSVSTNRCLCTRSDHNLTSATHEVLSTVHCCCFQPST